MLVLLLLSTVAISQVSKSYNVYVDRDNQATTGCIVLQPDFATQFDGIEGYLSITIGSSPVAITSALYYECQGGVFDSGSSIVTAALGLNTNINGDDVFEMEINTFDLGIRSSTSAKFYYTSESATSSDIVVVNNSGGGILFGVAFPIPALSFLSLLLLTLIVLVVARKTYKNKVVIVTSIMLFSTVVWSMFTFVIDGDVSDWSSFTAINDPVADNSGPGNFSDITQVFGNLEQDKFTARMDVVDVENQAPTADDIMAGNLLEDGSLMITFTGADLDGDALTFNVAGAPGNGQVSAVTPINATSASAVYTPDPDYVGNDSFTYVANDGQVNSLPATVSLVVDPVNDAPSFTSGGNVTVLEDSAAYSAAWASAISSGPSDESGQLVSFNIVTVSNATLFSAAPVLDAAGNLSFTAAADAAGTSTVTVNIMDDGGTANGGVDTSANITFDIIITDVNDVPSFTKGADETVLEDAGVQTVAGWATALSTGPASESGQVLSFNVSNDNNTLFSVQPTVNAAGDLSYTPNADVNGTTIVTISVSDDGGTANGGVDTSGDQTFNITVTAVNDVPSFTKGADQTVLEDLGIQSVPGWATAISKGPADESTQTVSFNVSNSNNTLFSVQPAVSATGTLTYTPNTDASGIATVTINVMDDGGTANSGVDTSADQTFTITITDINDVPSFTAGGNQTVLEDAGTQSVAGWATALSAGPASESGQTLSFNVSNNNNALFSTQPTVSSTGVLTYTTTANANGSATVSVSIMDDGGTANGGVDTSIAQMFTITVTAVNDAPSFTNGGNVGVLEDSMSYNMPWASAISAGPADEAGQTTAFNITGNSAPTLFLSGPSISNTGQLSFTPAADAVGVATISVNIMDNGGVANGGSDTSTAQMFTITLNQVNDAPSFTKGADQTFNQDSGAHTINAWATALSKGPANESTQTLSFNVVSNNNTALFSAQPSINAAGDLSFTSAAATNGTAAITINIMDDGGTANGGVDTSANQSFNITILNPPPAKADPTFSATTNIQVNTPVSTGLLSGATGSGTLVVGNAMNPAPTTTTAGGDLNITAATGAFTYNPPAGLDTGTDTFVYKICNATQCSADITVTFNLSGNTVWFIDKAAAAGGDGRLSTPFNSIASFKLIQGVVGTDKAAAGDFIYMEAGSYSDSLVLLNNQTIIGKGTTSGSLDSLASLTPALNSVTRPPLNGAQPVLSSTASAITTGMNNTIRGIEIGNTTNLGLVALNFGTLTISDVDIVGSGGVVNINGGVLNANFGTLSSTGNTNNGAISIQNVASGSFTVSSGGTNVTSANNGVVLLNNNSTTFNFNGATGLSINATPGATSAFKVSNGGIITSTGNGVITSTNIAAVDLATTQIGAAGLSLRSVSANGGTLGVILSTINSAGTFRITGTGTTNGSGGTIQNTTLNGIFIASANNIDIRNMNLTNATTIDTGAVNSNAAIVLNTASNVNLVNLNLTGHVEHGILGTSVTNLDISNSTITGTGADTETNEHGIFITNLLGTGGSASVFNNVTINDSQDTAILIANNTNTGQLTIQNSTINNAGDSGVNLITNNVAATLTVNVTGSTITNTIDGVSYIAEAGLLAGTVGGAGALGNVINSGLGGDMVNGIRFFSNGVMGNTPIMNVAATNNIITLDAVKIMGVAPVSGLNGVGVATGGSGTVRATVNDNTINSTFSGILTQTVHGVFVNNEGTGTTVNNVVGINGNVITLNPATGTATAETVGIGVDGGLSGGGITVRSVNNTITANGDASNGSSVGAQILPTEFTDPAGTNNRVCIGFTGNNISTPNNPFAAAFMTTELDVIAAPVTASSFLDVENSPNGVRTPAQLVTDLDAPLNTAEIGDATGSVSGIITGVALCPN